MKKETRGRKPSPKGKQMPLNRWAYQHTIDKLAELAEVRGCSEREVIETEIDRAYNDR